MLDLAVLLEDSARNVPDRVAVACGPTRLTYAELDVKASQVAGALAARGVGPGDRVALSRPNLPYFPVPHPSDGEEVKAFVVRVPAAELTEAGLVAWCKQTMAAYKYPRIVEFRDSLPMTATGKILKRELARQARPQQAQPAPAQSRS